MSVKNTAQGLHYAAHSSGTVQRLFSVKTDSYLNRLFGLRIVSNKIKRGYEVILGRKINKLDFLSGTERLK